MKATIFSYASSKGGVGKSSLLTLQAGWLTYIQDLKVLVIDADPQHSIYKQRDVDLTDQTNDSAIAYDIVKIQPDEVFDYIDLNKNDYDYIGIDLSGTLTTKGNIEAYACLEKIIIPSSTSQNELPESAEFYVLLMTQIFPVRKKLRMKEASVICQLNKIKKNLKGYKELCNDRDNKDYYPFGFLDADITAAEGIFGQDINTMLNERNLLIFDKLNNQCQQVYNYLKA